MNFVAMSDTYKTYNRDIKSTNTVLHVLCTYCTWGERQMINSAYTSSQYKSDYVK